MRAAVMRDWKLVVDDIPLPQPGSGEVLVKTLACGICGSDLHALKHGPALSRAAKEDESTVFQMDFDRDVVMGHEFCAEILDYGPDTSQNLKPGTRVCSIPITLRNGEVQSVGYSNTVPGGYAENMVLFEPLLLPVPNGLSTEFAAMTEPMAVGCHAVNMAGVGREDVPLVIGCGPVGLAVIMALKAAGMGPVIAADFSPARRKLAETVGADGVIDPAQHSPYQSWAEVAARDMDGHDMPPHPLTGGKQYRNGVYFECVGVPGIIDEMMSGAQRGCKVVVVGVCMESDHIRPLLGINKELDLQFVLGYTPEEFAETLTAIADGRFDVAPLITGRVGIDDVPGAFRELADPEKHAKILVEPDQ